MRVVKLAAFNVGLLIVLLFVVNIASVGVVILQKYRYVRKGASDARVDLPAFADKDRAREFFREFYRVESRFVPFEEWRYTRFAGQAINIDDNGLRQVPGLNSDGAHVHFFGGSTMWGTGVWDAETIPAYVARETPSVVAVNHGQSGHLSRQELNGLLSLLNSSAQVNAVVFYDGVNDIYNLCSVASSVNGHGLEALMGEAMRQQEQRHLMILRDILVGGTMQLIQLFEDRFGGGALDSSNRGSSCATDPAKAKQVADTLWANWNHARRALLDRGVPFLAVLQPVAAIGRPEVSYLPPSQSGQNRELQTVYPLLQQRIGDQEWLLDLSYAFDDAGPVFFDWAHASPRGNQMIARRIAERLKRLLP
jgi:hypothetical protein